MSPDAPPKGRLMSTRMTWKKNESPLHVVHVRIGRQKEIVTQEGLLPQSPRRVTSQRTAVSAHFLEDGSPSRGWPSRVTSWTAGHFLEGGHFPEGEPLPQSLPGGRGGTLGSLRGGRSSRVTSRRAGHLPEGGSFPGRRPSPTVTSQKRRAVYPRNLYVRFAVVSAGCHGKHALIFRENNAAIAQSVARGSRNPKVVSSIPTGRISAIHARMRRTSARMGWDAAECRRYLMHLNRIPHVRCRGIEPTNER